MTRPVRDPHLDLLDDARHAAGVADRSQRRLHGEAEGHDATFRGSLRDLAEHGEELLLETTVDRRIRGRVRALAEDHVEVTTATGTAWLRLAIVALVRAPARTVRAGGGERPTPAAIAFAAALRRVVEQRPTVEVVFTDGGTVRGTAIAIGRDVLTLHDDATGEHQLVHLATAAIVQTTDRPGTP